MAQAGYYRYPDIFQDNIVFVSENDLWLTNVNGTMARRLTGGVGACLYPRFSPDGKWIAYSSSDEGHSEVYIMPSDGGEATRLTYLGDSLRVVGWKDNKIIFSSTFEQPFVRQAQLYTVDPITKVIDEIKCGLAEQISYGPNGKQCVIQRNGAQEFGYWKRYKGGTAGHFWIDSKGDGKFHRLLDSIANFSRPMWIGERIYYCSDSEDHGNIYSCNLEGQDIKRHTNFTDFYTRNPATDGNRIIFHAGAELYFLDLKTDKITKIEIEYNSIRSKRSRKYVAAKKYLEDYDIHPKGHSLTSVSRGKAFVYQNWEGPCLHYGAKEDARYRAARWLNDGERLIIASDEEGEDHLEIYSSKTLERLSKLSKGNLGKIMDIKVSPTADEIVCTNHRNELIHVSLKDWKFKILDRNEYDVLGGFNWSPDGKWVAYACNLDNQRSVIKIVDVSKGTSRIITTPVLKDMHPSFDPEGKYLYFISLREFNPSWDQMHFEMGFPKGSRPYLITLQKDILSPFDEISQYEDEDKEDKKKKDLKKKEAAPDVKIDFEGIENRIVAFPIEDGRYHEIIGLKDGKVYISSANIDCALDEDDEDDEGGNLYLELYELKEKRSEIVSENITDFAVSNDQVHVLLRVGKDLRVCKIGEKLEANTEYPHFSHKNGWIDLSRAKVMINPRLEWEQMLREAWRLQRDMFWVEDMSKIEWDKIFKLYYPLVERVSSREEFQDLLWEMQGELGTSHAYASGGDLSKSPYYGVGSLGAKLEFDQKTGAYKVVDISRGDPWDKKASSPFVHPGVNINKGDLIWEINGKKLGKTISPNELLINTAGNEVLLLVSDAKGKNKRPVRVKTLRSKYPAQYREWVNKNREYVHNKSKGKVGYVHVPNMDPEGFAEFHRGYLAECDYEGLIIDVRYNGGGNVSALILEKLARRRLGYDYTRWFGLKPYPMDSPRGPMVALTNEHAGSDGDMFSHGFKMMKLGPLIGKRTWGGVIGISPRFSLVDGGYTTQPEFSFWFNDVEWAIENYGAEPDIDVDIKPQDYVTGVDPQLDRSIDEAMKLVAAAPSFKGPNMMTRSSLAPRKLI